MDTESLWSNITVNKGEVLYNTKVTHTFTYNGELKIKRINPLCDCVKFKAKDNNFTFSFTAKKTSNKIIVVTYENEMKEFLTISITIKNENK